MLNGTFGPKFFYFSNLNGTSIYELRGLDYIARACILCAAAMCGSTVHVKRYSSK